MSWGHMTKQEQAITFAGFMLTGVAAIYGQEYFGRVGFGVGFLGGMALTFVAKVWCWQYTNYEDGFVNPKFDRGQDDG